MERNGEAEKELLAPRKTEIREPLRVCFVCTGNTCRSPMAAAVANHLSASLAAELPEAVRECFVPPVRAYSAGLFAVAGDRIAQNAVAVLEEAGVRPISEQDYHLHTAHTLTEAEAAEYDLIVGMTPNHAMEVLLRFPAAAKRIITMPTAVSDPYGGDLARYRACLAEVIAGVKSLLFSAESDGGGSK